MKLIMVTFLVVMVAGLIADVEGACAWGSPEECDPVYGCSWGCTDGGYCWRQCNGLFFTINEFI